jgi:SAM-dependent methyltransferase
MMRFRKLRSSAEHGRMNTLKDLFRILRSRARRALVGTTPTTLDPRAYQPALPLPEGFTKERILEALYTVRYDGRDYPELRHYASGDCERFLHTLALVPDGGGRLLEIGANPYFTTLLLRRFRPGYAIDTTNYFGGAEGIGHQEVTFAGFDGSPDGFDAAYHSVNIETMKQPFEDAAFDVVVFGEVLEHLTNDPRFALAEISRVLKPGGILVLTTPNVARLENVVALIEGRNLYDPYSKYGPYGRHNREYTRDELHRLLTHCGFEVEASYTANVHPDHPAGDMDWTALSGALGRIRHREHDLGQYFFTRWRKVMEANPLRPSWLYRSYAAKELA